MKKLNSLLAVSAFAATAIGLASCGKEAKIEKYSNEVTEDVFNEKMFEASISEENRSYEVKVKNYESEQIEYNGVKIESQSNLELKGTFDVNNKISNVNGKSTYIQKDASMKVNSTAKINITRYFENEATFVVDMNEKAYYTSTSSSFDRVSYIDNSTNTVLGYLDDSYSEVKYYFDESGDTKIFTVVPKSDNGEIVVQYTISKDGYKLSLNRKYEKTLEENGNTTKEVNTNSIEVEVKYGDKTVSKPDITNFKKEF